MHNNSTVRHNLFLYPINLFKDMKNQFVYPNKSFSLLIVQSKSDEKTCTDTGSLKQTQIITENSFDSIFSKEPIRFCTI